MAELEHFNPVKTFFRALGISLLAAALSFFTGNFLGITGLAIKGVLSKDMPDFSMAYRYVGLPLALLMFAVAFVVVVVRDIRKLDR